MPLAPNRGRPRGWLAALLLGAAASCDRAFGPGGDEHAGHDHAGHEHAGPDHDVSGGSPQLHGQDDRGLVFVEPEDPQHPGTLQMGTIELGDLREATVRLKNVEKAPITITQVTAGCSCTLPEISYVDAAGERVVGDTRSSTSVLAIPSGATAELVLRVDSRLAPILNKDKNVIVRITTDSDLDPYVSVEARMRIEAPFVSAPTELSLGRVGSNAGAVSQIEIQAVAGDGRELVSILSAPPEVEATLAPSTRLGKPTWVVTARLLPPIPLGYRDGRIRLATTGPGGEGEGRPYEIRILWNGAPDVEVAPARFLFLRDADAGGRERAQVDIVSHMPGHWIRIAGRSLEGEGTEHLDVSVEPVFPNADGTTNRWRITLVPKPELGARALSGTMVVELDDPQHPRFEIPVMRIAR